MNGAREKKVKFHFLHNKNFLQILKLSDKCMDGLSFFEFLLA